MYCGTEEVRRNISRMVTERERERERVADITAPSITTFFSISGT